MNKLNFKKPILIISIIFLLCFSLSANNFAKSSITKPPLKRVAFTIDESASMRGYEDIANFLYRYNVDKNLNVYNSIYLTIYKFKSCSNIFRYYHRPTNTIYPLRYVANGPSTPLYDAIVKTVKFLSRYNNVTYIIITDGLHNCNNYPPGITSKKEYEKYIARLLTHLERTKNWEIEEYVLHDNLLEKNKLINQALAHGIKRSNIIPIKKSEANVRSMSNKLKSLNR